MTLIAYPPPRLLSLLALVCAALASGHAAAQASAATISPAETLLFETDHLARIKAPAVLVYDFRKVSNVEPGFSDKVQLDLAAGNGKTSATLHFLSGVHKHDTPALDDAHGNPVLLGFLERDIAEMKRLTGGSSAYFRKRIRMALADNAQVSTQSITYEGKSLPAQAVRIQPYLNDPMHERFEPYVHKTYTFIVSDGVPGGVYQLRSSLVNPDGTQVAGPATAATVTAKGSSSGSSKGASSGADGAVRASAAGRTAAGKPVAASSAAGNSAAGNSAAGNSAAGNSAAGNSAAGGAALPSAPAAAARTAAASATATGTSAIPGAANGTAAAGPAAGSPGAAAALGAAGAASPAIDETLTLVSVTHPKR